MTRHYYAIEYEHGRSIRNRTSVWAFKTAEARDEFARDDDVDAVSARHSLVQRAHRQLREERAYVQQTTVPLTIADSKLEGAPRVFANVVAERIRI